jgi:hypothetical protein
MIVEIKDTNGMSEKYGTIFFVPRNKISFTSKRRKNKEQV